MLGAGGGKKRAGEESRKAPEGVEEEKEREREAEPKQETPGRGGAPLAWEERWAQAHL